MADKEGGDAADGMRPAAHGEAYPGPPDYPAPRQPYPPRPHPLQQQPPQQHQQQQYYSGQPYPPPNPPQQYPPQNQPAQPYPPQDYPRHPQQQYPPQQYPPQYGPWYPQQRRPWFTGPPRGVPYHRMARTAAMRWWHLIVGTLAIVVAGFVVIAGLMFALMVVWYVTTGDELPLVSEPSSTDLIFTNDTADLAASLAVIAIFLPIVLLAAIVIQHRRPGTLASVLGRLRWRWLLTCLVAAIVTCLVSYGLSVAVATTINDPGGEASWVGWSRFAVPALVVVVLVPLQATAEEFFFRGWLLQGIAAYTLEGRRGGLARRLAPLFGTAWPAIVLSGVVFVFGHGYTGWGILDVFGFAVVSGWLAVRTGGLESSIAIHVANNLVAFLLSAAAGDLGLEQGSVRWQYVVTDVLPLIGYAAFVLWLARRKQVATVIP